jgi:hypothetical protein
MTHRCAIAVCAIAKRMTRMLLQKKEIGRSALNPFEKGENDV